MIPELRLRNNAGAGGDSLHWFAGCAAGNQSRDAEGEAGGDGMSIEPLVLDLCAGSGNWSEPYVAAGCNVVRVDLPLDVRLLEFPGRVHGILAAPPCTVFANSGARWPRSDTDYRDALSVVDACLRLVVICKPVWWALENPIGKLVRWLGPPAMYFNPSQYGDPYTKRTALWGRFTPPARTPVEPTLGSFMHTKFGGKSDHTKRARSATPAGFARAFASANPCPPMQLELTA